MVLSKNVNAKTNDKMGRASVLVDLGRLLPGSDLAPSTSGRPTLTCRTFSVVARSLRASHQGPYRSLRSVVRIPPGMSCRLGGTGGGGSQPGHSALRVGSHDHAASCRHGRSPSGISWYERILPRACPASPGDVLHAGVGGRSMTTLERVAQGPPADDGVARPPAANPPGSARSGPFGRFMRGRVGDPAWVRPTLILLLAATAALYLWGLGASGWANSFYSAAVQAGTRSWKAFLFGSSDASNFITVDKPPAALWVMELSARLFGVNAWSILVPQALEGVATVAVVYAAVRRWFGPSAGLLAGAVLALTPVAALMFRYNNPDTLLVLLLALAAYATTRAVEDGRTRWLVLAGTLVGLGFLTKMLQALVVVPVFAAVYVVAGPPKLGQRVTQLMLSGVALVVSGGWWVAVVQLTPAADRPYVGGSQNNSLIGLILGYNGFGRLTGNEAGSVGGGAAAGSRWGPTGWSRLFGADMGARISWLIPAALLFTALCLWLGRRAPRTDRTRAALVLWAGWLLVTGALFSFAQGIIHPYYTVALAPAVGALIAIGVVTLWRRRTSSVARIMLGLAIGITAIWAFVLLDRTPTWLPPLRWAVLVVGLMAAAGVTVRIVRARRIALAIGLGGLATGLVAPTAVAIETAATPHSGAIPSAGPPASTAGFGPGGGPAGGRSPGTTGGLPGAGRGGPAGSVRPRGRLPGPGLGAPRGRFASDPRRGRPQAGGVALPEVLRAGGPPEVCSTRARPAHPSSGGSNVGRLATAGWRPLSGPIRPPGTSWPLAIRSWRSGGSTARIRHRRWPSSRTTWGLGKSTTSLGKVPAAVAPWALVAVGLVLHNHRHRI